MSSQFSQPHFLHTCSGRRFLASKDIVMHLCSKFVVDLVEILTEVVQFGEIQI